MYSKEDRERILADFRESGMPLATFCRLPGKPSRNSLRSWRDAADRGELDVPAREVRGRCEHARHKAYPEETKREALRLLARGMRPADVARRLGVASGGAVASWARKRGRMPPKEAVPMADEDARARIARLEKELARSRMQVEALKEMVRDPKAGGPASLSNRRKAELCERLRRERGFPLKEILAFLSLPKSSYEYARRSLARDARREEEVAERARSVFEASGRTYGYRRVRAGMARGEGGGAPMRASEREVRRAMRAGNMVPRHARGRARWSSYAGEVDGRPGNVPLNGDGTHDFKAAEPWRLVVTDVTEFRVRGGKAYLSPVIDCFDGEPVAWSISRHPDSGLSDSSLEMFLAKKPEGSGPVVAHTDGGGVYRSGSWKRICRDNGVTRSMSRKSCCADNARAEGFFGTLKEEFYRGRDWSQVGYEPFERLLNGYLEWYVHGRLKAFREGGRTVYDTIAGRRKRLGYTA